MNASDGSGKKNLSNNDSGVQDYSPVYSPNGQWISYVSEGIQSSNYEGDGEIYVMNAQDGSGKKNLSNNGAGVYDDYPAFSPDSQSIAYSSQGDPTSNPEGDYEVYVMSASDGTGQTNLSNNGGVVDDYSPNFSHGGKRIAYTSYGKQTSNSQGDTEVYVMNALDGTGKKNLTNNGDGIHDFSPPAFSPDGTRIVYGSYGKQTSNPEGDTEVYVMNALDGLGKKNLTNNGARDYNPDWGRQAN